jgi:hypothetical protein
MEKIDIRDLSIGDWVRVRMCKLDYDDPDTLDAKVLSIEGNSVGVGYDNSGIVMSAFVDDLQPMPITVEILEKNGWKLSKSNWFEFEDGEWEINIWIGKYKCNIEISQKREIYASPYADIQVVKSNINTLQHALRLVGVGKEIVL